MSLILAVEPDRRRGRQLTALVRRFTKADIVVAQSGAAAISAMGGRVPDLILIPALLPTQDETAITTWVRELGDAAAHVQTLAVPILAEPESGQQEAGGGSILGKLLDRSDAASAHGCDPSVFADQIKVYLDRAATDRSARQVPDAAPASQSAERSIDILAAGDGKPPAADFDFEEISLDSLVLEPLFIEPPEASQPARPEPKAEPPAPAAPDPRDASAVRTLERELGVGGTSGPKAPALWRVAEGHAEAPQDEWALFDPSQTRFKALVRRLDEIVAQHAAQV